MKSFNATSVADGLVDKYIERETMKDIKHILLNTDPSSFNSAVGAISVMLNYGLVDGNPRTISDISKIMNLPKDSIRDHIFETIGKIKDYFSYNESIINAGQEINNGKPKVRNCEEFIEAFVDSRRKALEEFHTSGKKYKAPVQPNMEKLQPILDRVAISKRSR